MQHVRFPTITSAVLALGLSTLAANGALAAADVIATASSAVPVNMWDGQWHVEVSPYAWIPWLYSTVQLPPAAGGGNPTIETQPSQYLKHVEAVAMLEGSVRKGDFSLWTDFVFMNLNATPERTKRIGLPGGDGTLPVNLAIDTSIKAAIWTLAPSYTVLNNDIATLDILAGIRYTSLRFSLAYNFTAPPTALNRGGGYWPSFDSTDGIIGIKGTVRLSPDGKWFAPYEADIGDGDKNWQYNLMLGAGYHFRWGDVSLLVRDLVYDPSQRPIMQKIRMTGPMLGASFRW